jgi:mitochondrial distribution and morphology protein 10
MLTFMDYVLSQFASSTDWNHDNSYSALTATSDALLSFATPSTLSLHVSSLSTPHFATAYTLSTLGQIDGSISYLYSTTPLGHIPSRSTSIPLRTLVRGYRDIRVPTPVADASLEPLLQDENGRRPTLLHASLALPAPSVLTALYARRIGPETLLSISLNSKSVPIQSAASGPPPATVLAHVQHDTGRYSVEGLGSTDNSLLGVRGLWNFGLGPSKVKVHTPPPEVADELADVQGTPDILPAPATPTDDLDDLTVRLAQKPSLLSAGAEFYYSPFSHVIGMSTGLRFTALVPSISNASSSPAPPVSSNKPLAGTSAALSSRVSSLLTPSNVAHSSFPYTMTLTATPLIGSLASTYSVRPTPHLALSSRFDFNVYSWESNYVLGLELWRRKRQRTDEPDPLSWAKLKTASWFDEAEAELKAVRKEREEENVIKVRVDDGWNIRALWSGRVKELLVSVGASISPVKSVSLLSPQASVEMRRWNGTVGVEIAYST